MLSKESDSIIDKNSIKKLLLNIMKIDEQKAEQISNIEIKDMKPLYNIIALWQYIHNDSEIIDSMENDLYMKIIKQVRLLNNFKEKKTMIIK